MHICPQEIIAIMTAYDALRPYLGVVGLWCKQCVSGEHKTCDDHENHSKHACNKNPNEEV